MYTPDDTRKMVFSLREVFHYHTQKIAVPTTDSAHPENNSPMPGEILRITASPMSAMIKKSLTTDGDPKWHINTLGFTASRWREIRYVGTRIQLVPQATTGKVDPADITQTQNAIPRPKSGSSEKNDQVYAPQGSIHPLDAVNFFSYRGWLGGNFNVAAWDPTKVMSEDEYVDACLKYDQAWLADDRFRHVKLTDGCTWDSAPLVTSLETAALGANSLFGFSDEARMGGSFMWDDVETIRTTAGGTVTDDDTVIGKHKHDTGSQPGMLWRSNFLDAYFQPHGLTMPTAGNEIHAQRWLPNPLAGFKYATTGGYSPGDENFTITGYWEQFPWFADRTTIGHKLSSEKIGSVPAANPVYDYYGSINSYDLDYLVELCIEKFLNPIGIVRFPCAYGTMFFWNVYLEHIFELRKPFLTNSAWNVGLIESMGHDPTPIEKMAGEFSMEDHPELTPTNRKKLIQSLSPDPYGCTESPMVLTIADLAPHMSLYREPDQRYREPIDEIETAEPEE